MGTSYDLYCLDCDEFLGVDWYTDESLAELWAERDLLAAVARSPLQLRLEHDWQGRFDVGFFDKHREHNVRIRDDSGQYVGDCFGRFTCRECGHHGPCRLPHGHEGDHSQRRPK